MNRHYVTFLVDGSARFIGSSGLKRYGFVADVAGHSKIAIISHGRDSSLKKGAGTERMYTTCDASART